MLFMNFKTHTCQVTKIAEGVRVLVKIDIGFMNETVPETLAGKAVYVCLLLETSDGRKLHFSRLR